jgi:hypothetical protein
MAGGIGTTGALVGLNYLFGKSVTTPPPTTYYAALVTGTETDGAGGTEVSTGTWTNYARTAITNDQTHFPAVSSQPLINGAIISFGTAAITPTSTTVTPTAVALYDASTAGNLWGWALITSPPSIGNGIPVSFAAGALSFNMV